MKTLNKIYNYFRCIPKSLLFNFYYLPFKQAIKFPIIVNHRTKIISLNGVITVPNDAKIGKIKLGFGCVQIVDNSSSKLLWNISKTGIVSFGHNNKIGAGCKLHISGELRLGDKVNFSGESCIISHKKICFGDNCLISWGTLFMDTDFHPILDSNNNRLNPNKSINIGHSVWIGAKATLMKGVTIGNNCIVSANSHVTKKFDNNLIIGGNPALTIGSMTDKRFTD